MTTARGGQPDWAHLVPRLVHPAKVSIIEALAAMDAPKTAQELVFGLPDALSAAQAEYHLRELTKAGIVDHQLRSQTAGTDGPATTYRLTPFISPGSLPQGHRP
jgi:hypothetical protein